MRGLRLAPLLLCWVLPLAAQSPGDKAGPAAAAPIVSYDIEVELDPVTHTFTGRQTIRYTNQSPDIIPDLRFHTYLNAAKNHRSTYYQEAAAFGDSHDNAEDPGSWGFIHITAARQDGVDVLDTAGYFIGPDGTEGDETVWRLPLRAPLFPGESVTVELAYTAQLPWAWDRLGYHEDFHMMVQWFPKLGVWETTGQRGAEKAGWNCRHFHYQTEFFANFGNYRVRMIVPKGYVLGATGKRVGEEDLGDRIAYTHQQDDVHDFAWTVSQKFEQPTAFETVFRPSDWITEEEIQAAMTLHGLPREDIQLSPVKIILLMQPQHMDQARRHFDAVCQSLKYFGLWYGRYPYETLTVVDTPRVDGAGNFAGGMEYPTLITIGTRVYNPDDYLSLEGLIVHEFGHQYWYGLVGSNEFEEPWLDEGFNTYSSAKVMHQVHGPYYSFSESFGVPFQYWRMFMPPHPRWRTLLKLRTLDPDRTLPRMISSHGKRFGIGPRNELEDLRVGTLNGWDRDKMRRNGWEYYNYGYGINAYSKPALMMYQLELLLGERTMAKVMRTWFDEQKYRNPGTDDFIATVNRITGKDMNGFFAAMMDGVDLVDYEVVRIRNRSLQENVGFFDGPDGPAYRNESGRTGRQVVTLANKGGMALPVDIAVRFADGSEITETWDGKDLYTELSYPLEPVIDTVVIDPENRIVMDKNRVNNSREKQPTPKDEPMRKRLWFMVQNLLQTLAGSL